MPPSICLLTVGQAPFVLICDRRGAVACALRPDLSDAAIGNHLLDLVRRRTLGLKFVPGTIQFRLGHDHPLLLVSPEGQQKPGDTARFSLRRRRGAGHRYERCWTLTRRRSPKQPWKAPPQPLWRPPSGRRVPPEPARDTAAPAARPVPDNAAGVAASARAAAERDWNAPAALSALRRPPTKRNRLPSRSAAGLCHQRRRYGSRLPRGPGQRHPPADPHQPRR